MEDLKIDCKKQTEIEIKRSIKKQNVLLDG